jgi:hypothetical protein
MRRRQSRKRTRARYIFIAGTLFLLAAAFFNDRLALFIPLGATALLLWAWALSVESHDRLVASRRRRNRCTACAYDLTANVTGICPECGSPIPNGAPV